MNEKIIFEVIPSPKDWRKEKVFSFCKKIVEIMKEEKIKFLNIPEVVNETARNEKRNIPYKEKIDNIDFSECLKSLFSFEPIINKICVRMEKKDFENWVSYAYSKGINYFVLVGGESSKINYPGYTVIEAAKFIKKNFPDVKLGGITIFTRVREPYRILEKMKAGIEFFVSQIIFETSNMKQVLIHLLRLVRIENIKFPYIYISLAPAKRIKDIEFMKWLGVEFPTAVNFYITENERKVESRTLEVIERMIDEIFDFSHKERLNLGFNIEHVMYSNLELSKIIIEKIKERL
ncbi:MAG: hypothetical protein ABDH49_02510 [Candidatus Hydrothermales bacterium]